MKPKRTPPSEFIQRKKLLKDAYQKRTTGGYVNGRTTSISPREIRKSVAQLFQHTPLIPLTQEEQGVLKEQARTYLTARLIDDRKILNKLLIGEERIENPQNESRLHVVFSNPQLFEKSKTVRGFALKKNLPPFKLRQLTEYDADVSQLLQNVTHRVTQGPIRILDIGAGNNKMLAELKHLFREEIETHALAVDDLPRYHADYTHFAMAEHMPAHFAGKFDVITSNWQIEYSMLPHLVFRNIAAALAPGGEAEIAVHDESLHDALNIQGDVPKKIKKYYERATLEEKKKCKKRQLSYMVTLETLN